MKKILATALLTSVLSLTIMPALAINSKNADEIYYNPAQKRGHFSRKKTDEQMNEYKFAYINYDWWNIFEDDYLNAYIRQAIENNHQLKASTLATQEYYQAMKMQFSQELPQVMGGIAPAYVKMPGTTHSAWSYAVPLFASYEADIFLKNHDKTKSAKKSYEASLQDERSAYISIASAVGTTYLNIVKLDKIIAIQQEITDMRSKLYELEKLRYEEGISSSMDVVQTEKGFILAQDSLIELKKAHYQLLTQFAVLIGESPENIDTLTRKSFDELGYLKEIPTEISTETIINRPDYIKAEKLVEKAGLDVRVAKKEFLPTFAVGGVALFNNSELAHLFTTKGALTAIGLNAIGSLFTGGRKVANLKMKKAQYKRILENYYQTNLTAVQEVNNSLFVLKSDDERYQQLLGQYKDEMNSYELNEERYKEGVLSEYDLMRYRESLLTLEKQIDSYKINSLVNLIGLYKATASDM